MAQRRVLRGKLPLAAVAVQLAVAPALAGPTWAVGVDVPRDRLVSMDQIDHRPWTELLRRYVDQRGLVAYSAWKASVVDQQALDDYLARLSTAGPRISAQRAARLAFWINAYNAVTMRGVLREYPATSIRRFADPQGYNIWRDLYLIVGGERYSLERMENDVLRKMSEPRIHFAIVRATRGGGSLRAEAYESDRVNGQLGENTAAFLALPQNFRDDSLHRLVEVSPILEWFAEDFGATPEARLRTIAPYLPNAEARRLAESGRVRIEYLPYDGALNDQAGERRSR